VLRTKGACPLFPPLKLAIRRTQTPRDVLHFSKGLSTARPYGELPAAVQALAREYWREQGWTWGEHDSEQLAETLEASDHSLAGQAPRTAKTNLPRASRRR
jgi:hypothetical protein